jgi:hypothetical protein
VGAIHSDGLQQFQSSNTLPHLTDVIAERSDHSLPLTLTARNFLNTYRATLPSSGKCPPRCMQSVSYFKRDQFKVGVPKTCEVCIFTATAVTVFSHWSYFFGPHCTTPPNPIKPTTQPSGVARYIAHYRSQAFHSSSLFRALPTRGGSWCRTECLSVCSTGAPRRGPPAHQWAPRSSAPCRR